MASAAKLVETLAIHLREPIADIGHRARRLRESGLLPQEGHGRGVADVDTYNCAVLLLSILATDIASHSVQAVDAVGELPRTRVVLSDDFVLIPQAKFLQAIEYIIEKLREPENAKLWLEKVRAIGVTTIAQHQYGWIETPPHEAGFVMRAVYERGGGRPWEIIGGRMVQGKIVPAPRPISPGVLREVSVGVSVLQEIAALLGRKGENE